MRGTRKSRGREELGAQLRDAYEGGASIRTLVARTGKSYGAVHAMLLDAGATMRSRGGPNHRARPA